MKEIYQLYSKSRFQYNLVNLGAFFITLPYVAPVPLNSDVQYTSFFIAFIVVLIDVFKGRFKITRIELYFLWISALSFVYINPVFNFEYSIEKRVGLLFGFLIFYVFSRYWYWINPKSILLGIYINFTGVLFQYFYPSIFKFLAEPFVRTIKIQNFQSRGPSGFAPEPGFIGGMAAFFILVTYILLKQNRITKKTFFITSFFSIALLFLSKSGTSMMFLFVISVTFFFFTKVKIWKKLLFLIISIYLASFLLFYSGLGGRGLDVARKLATFNWDFFQDDYSIAYRGISIAVGISSLAQGNILGHGVGTLRYVSQEIIENSDFSSFYQHVLHRSGGLLSSLSQYLVEMGLFFLILLLLLYYNSKPFPYVFIVRIVSIFFLITSYSILFPPFWMLIAGTDKRTFQKKSFQISFADVNEFNMSYSQ